MVVQPRPVWRRYAPTAVLAVAAGIAALCAGRHYVEQQMAWELQSQARARGVELAWQTFQLDWDGSLHVQGIRAFDAQGNRAEVAGLRLDWTLATLIRGQVAPSAVFVQAPRMSITQPRLPSGSDEPSPALATRQALSSLGEGPALDWPISSVELAVIDGAIDITGLPAPVNHVRITGLESQADAASDGAQATWSGVCELGCGTEKPLTGRLEYKRGSLLAEATAKGGFSLRNVHPSVREARAARAVLHRTSSGSEVTVDDVSAEIQTGGWAGSVRAPSVILAAGDKRVLRPVIRLNRRPRTSSPSGSSSDPLELFDKLLARLDGISLEDGTIHIEDALRLDRVDAGVSDGAGQLGATWRGGRFVVSRQAGDPQTEVALEEFDLSALEGVVALPANWKLGGAVNGTIRFEKAEQWPSVVGLVRRRYVRPVTKRSALQVTASLDLHSGSVLAPPISELPIAPGGHVELEVAYAPAGERTEDRLSIRKASWTRPTQGEPIHISGVLEARNVLGGVDPLAITVDVNSRELDCGHALASLPSGLLPRIGEHVRAEGRFAPAVHFAVDLRNAWTLELTLDGLPGTCKVTELGPYAPDYLAGDFKQEVREGTTRPITVGPLSGRWVRLKAIPPAVSAAAWMTEQVGFRHEGGLHLRHVKAALRRNFEKGRFAYGGSTIAQQLVKNLFLTRRKTLSRKLEEAIIVWRMEDVLTKERILELYLNCIEFGPDVYGIAHAAKYYFGKHASQLTPMEGAFLALLKPSPKSAARFKHAGATPRRGWWPKQLGYMMERFHRRGYIGPQEVSRAAPYVLTFR